MSTPYIGQILAVGFNYAPVGWALCDGSLLQISQNDALFNLIGTTYGGDGVSTFALPDLRGRVPVDMGPGSVLGASMGSETVTLTAAQMPAHTHSLLASAKEGATNAPGPGLTLATTAAAPVPLYAPPGTLQALAPSACDSAGGGQPHDNMQPFVVVNYIIALFGVYPSQN